MAENQVQRFHARTYEEAQFQRLRLVSEGYEFVRERREADQVTIVLWKKTKGMNWVLFILLLCFYILHGVLYAMHYAGRGDEVVEIEFSLQDPLVTPVPSGPEVLPAPAGPQLPPTVLLSPDREEWWDGVTWRGLDEAIPSEVERSTDGTAWWDGEEWRPVPFRSA